MIPMKCIHDEIRWMPMHCAHNVSVYTDCPECIRLTADARQMMAPINPNDRYFDEGRFGELRDGKDGTHVPDPR